MPVAMIDYEPYAVSDAGSRGRVVAEPRPKARSEFQRDRDRIVHSTAFRRLEYKTQVFVNHEGDLFRTRLTHSIEVAQIARTIARALNLNDDLTEAIALAHDLGHTPFGHAGQDALNACMKEYGGFEHNLQSLRTVDRLEERYGAFDGLNLMYETREGILKHCSPKRARELGALGERFLEDKRPSLEAQICNLADEVAYNNHDVDDGLRSGLISVEQLEATRLFARHVTEVRRNFPESPLQADVTRNLAVAYTESNHPGEAAAEFERIAQSPGESPDVQREATLQAADLYEKAGNAAKSRAMLEAFVKHFPQPLNPAMEARSRLSV